VKKLQDMTEPELREIMTGFGRALGLAAHAMEVELPLFVLVIFNDPKIAQYISNCERECIIEAMRETAERLEKRQDIPR
jgi:hypothetical protein